MLKKSSKYLHIFIIFALSVLLVLFWRFFGANANKVNVRIDVNKGVCVHFIDVDQGDCELIMSGGHAVLIDAGERDKGVTVVQYLRRLGLKKIDYVIATHPHTDHIGGLNSVINNLSVGEIIMPKIPQRLVPTNVVYRRLLETIINKNIKVRQAVPGDVLNLGESSLNILGPISENYDNLNDFSVGALLSYKNVSFLFCGDMQGNAEQDLLKSKQNIKADVFKLSHHGSKTSNGKKFLKAVNPKYCVAEVGKNNIHNHPHAKVLNILNSLGIKNIYRTDMDGSIIFYTDGEKIDVQTQKKRKPKSNKTHIGGQA